MPSKRRIVELRTRTELLDLVGRFELEVEDRRVKEHLVDAVARSHRVSLAQVLPSFSPDRLKEMCAALDLDDGGRADIQPRIYKGISWLAEWVQVGTDDV